MLILISITTLAAIGWGSYYLQTADFKAVEQLTDEQLDEEIRMSAGFNDRDCVFYDERERRDAVRLQANGTLQ